MEKLNLNRSDNSIFKDLKCPLFPGDTIYLEALASRYENDINTFKKNELIFRQGDRIRHLHILLSGELHGLMILSNGEQIEVDRMEVGMPIAVALIFADQATFPVDVEALTNGTLWRIPIETYKQMLQEEQCLLSAFLKVSSNAFSRITEKLNLISTKGLRGKIAHFILMRTSEQHPTFVLQRTRADFANYLGVQRPSLSRTLTEMQEMKLIEVQGRHITVLDRQALQYID